MHLYFDFYHYKSGAVGTDKKQMTRDVLKVNADESEILTIIARSLPSSLKKTENWNCSSFTNDFSHRDPGGFGEIHLMFPLTAMLNHSCFPNIARWKERQILQNHFFPNFLLRSVRRPPQGGFLMRVVAARPIKKGQITVQYIITICFLMAFMRFQRMTKYFRWANIQQLHRHAGSSAGKREDLKQLSQIKTHKETKYRPNIYEGALCSFAPREKYAMQVFLIIW